MGAENRRVLVVDDEPLVIKVASRLFEFLEYECVAAECGEDALKLLRDDEQIDIVVLDLNMPGLSGLETLARLREFRATLPVILSSGALSERVDDPLVWVLAKPYRLEALEETLVAAFA